MTRNGTHNPDVPYVQEEARGWEKRAEELQRLKREETRLRDEAKDLRSKKAAVNSWNDEESAADCAGEEDLEACDWAER